MANELEKITQDLDAKVQGRSSFNASIRSGLQNNLAAREGVRSQLNLGGRPRNMSDDLNHSKQSMNSLNSREQRSKATPERSKYITIQFDGKRVPSAKPVPEKPREQSEFETLMQQAENYEMDPESRKILKLYLSDDPILHKTGAGPTIVKGDNPSGPTGGSQDSKPNSVKPVAGDPSTPPDKIEPKEPLKIVREKPKLDPGV